MVYLLILALVLIVAAFGAWIGIPLWVCQNLDADDTSSHHREEDR